jgi:mRNA interferase RelE/StbE
MAWRVEFSARAEKQLDKIDPVNRARILQTLKRDLARHDHPRDFGEAMIGNWTGYWRYRVGDYRAICKIEDAVVTVFVIEVGHRRHVYR